MLSEPILAGVRIIEASAFVAAPLGGMTLAQLGAEVIRIDPPNGGLDYRRWPVTQDNVSLFWCGLNKSKKSVTIDLACAEGRELATALITAPGPDAGMLLTNFPARGALDYETLRQRRPDLIQLTITGDRTGRPAVDYTINPLVGMPLLTGEPDSNQVCNHVLPAWDLITGHMAAIGILAAERVRRQKGTGQHVTLALEDAAQAVMGHLGFIAEAQLGTRRERSGNYLFGAFGRDFSSADGERVMVVGLTLKQWRALCRATEIEHDIASLEQKLNIDLDKEGERFNARHHIAALIETWCQRHPYAHIAASFEKNAVCWGKYQTVQELVANRSEGIRSNPLFSTIEQPGVGEYLMPGLPLNFSSGSRLPPRPAPTLGEHTEEVLSTVLGLSSAELGRLLENRIIGLPRSI